MKEQKNTLIVSSSYTGGEKTHIDQLVSNLKYPFYFCVPYGQQDQLSKGACCCTYSITSPKSYFRFLDMIKEYKTDIIHCHGLRAATFVRLASLFKSKFPVILVTIHGFHYARYKNVIKRKMFLMLERWLHNIQQMTITVSRSDYQQMLDNKCIDQKKAVTIENGVKLLSPDAVVKKDEIREELLALGVDPSGDYLIYGVGALEWVKGYDVLLKAAAKVRKNHKNVKILLFGSGSQYKNLKELSYLLGIEENVIFMGKKTNLPDWLAFATVFVMSSRYEGLPYALLEAMNSGVPVIASKVPGCSEIINGRNGLLFIKDDDDDLAGKVLTVISDKEIQKKLVSNGFNTLKERFNEKDMILKVEKVYNQTYEQ